MQIIPLQAVPDQILSVSLGTQACQIQVYQLLSGLYVDLYVNNVLIIGGVICENFNRIVRSLYLGFIGDLIFADTQENADPYYTGLGSQFILVYLTPADLDGLG